MGSLAGAGALTAEIRRRGGEFIYRRALTGCGGADEVPEERLR